MQNVSPVLIIFLVACIGFFAIDLVVDLAFGETSFIGRIMTPLLCGLFAFLFARPRQSFCREMPGLRDPATALAQAGLVPSDDVGRLDLPELRHRDGP